MAVRGYDRALPHGISSTETGLMLASKYVDDILLVVSAQVDHLLPAGNLRPTPLALHDLGSIPGQCDIRWPPQFVDLRASTSMLYSAPVVYSYLKTALDNTTVWLSEFVIAIRGTSHTDHNKPSQVTHACERTKHTILEFGVFCLRNRDFGVFITNQSLFTTHGVFLQNIYSRALELCPLSLHLSRS